jgi:site-specific recombinase XerD
MNWRPRKFIPLGIIMNMEDSVHGFLRECKLKKLSFHTQRAYALDLYKFLSWSRAAFIDSSLCPRAIEGWRSHLDDSGYAATTIKRRLATLRAMVKWLERNDRITENPFAKIDVGIKLPRRLPRNLAQRDLRLLLAGVSAGARGTALPALLLQFTVELILTTGIRVGEACSITMDDVDLEARTIRIFGKGSRERQVFLVDDQLVRLAKRYIKARARARPTTNHLIVNPRGRPASTDYIRRTLHEAVGETAIAGKVTPHMLRHTAATQLIECGVDIRFVQRLLGHSSIATTEIYTHVSDTALRSAILGAGVRRRMGDEAKKKFIG